MEVREGYKKTEIGVIPKDWNLITFNKAFYFLTTASYSRAQISEIGNIYYVHYGDIHTKLEHFLDFEKIELPFIKKEQLRNYNLLKEGDLIMADASEDYEGIGKSVEIKNIDNKKDISGLHTFLLRGKEGVFTNGFKGYIRSNKFVKSQLDKLATGLKVYGVSKENLKTIQIPLPQLPEQKAIAEVLSDTYNLIQALEKRIAKKRLIKQGAMQKLLTPKENWEVKELIKLASITTGSKNTQDRIDDGKYPFFVRSQTIERINSYSFDGEAVLTAGDGVGTGKIFHYINGKFDFHQRVYKISHFNEKLDGYFFFLYFSNNFYNRIMQMTAKSSVDSVRMEMIANMGIPLPPLPEQEAIAEVLFDMDEEIETLEKKLTKYKQLKQGLMQNLLTGKIRLVNTTQIKKENKVKVVPIKQKGEQKLRKNHNWQINEAVVISVLTKKFGTEDYPLGRKRYTKLSYLFHRYIEKKTKGYLKKAAGPYNPYTKYKGPETIAQGNKYIQNGKKGNFNGFVIAKNIAEAERYFENWYGKEALEWLEQFRFEKNDTLELWTTVDMAIQDLATEWKTISVETVKAFINNHEEWKPKLKRSIFSNENIEKAINKLQSLFKEH
jgi:type I restriction enzyme S subunit